MTQQLTDHLNRVDKTNSIKFTHEEEAEGTIPFFDTLLVRKESGEVKLLIFRKNTHTDQYLNFSSHHPLHQKMGVIRTLLDRQTLVTEEEDKRKTREHIKEALTRCGYPQWTISTVQTKMKTKKEDNVRKKTSKGMRVLPYVQGLSESTSWIMKKYKVNTAYSLTSWSLVRPKDKVEPQKMCKGVYSITCKNCNATYIGETKRTLGTRIKEHKEDAEKASASRPYT